MNNLTSKVIILVLITIFLVNGCVTSPLVPFTISPTVTLTFTPTPTSTPVPTPTSTPTPIPVSVKEAIEQGTFAEIETFGKGFIVQSVFTPDGSQFIAVTLRGIYIYDATAWQEIKYIPVPIESPINVIDISFDGKIFATGDASGYVTFWNTQTWNVAQSIKVHEGQITSLKISPDKITFVVVGEEKTISIWSLNEGSQIASQTPKNKIGSVFYSADGQWVFNSEETSFGDLKIRKASNLEIVNSIHYYGFREDLHVYRRFPYYRNYAISPFVNVAVLIDFHSEKLIVQNLASEEILAELPIEYSWWTGENIVRWVFLDKSQLIIKGDRSDFFYLVNIETYNLRKLSSSELSSIVGDNPLALIVTKEKEIQDLGFASEFQYSPEFIMPNGDALILKDFWYGSISGVRDIGIMELTQGHSMIKSLQLESGYWVDLTRKNENLAIIKLKQKEKKGSLIISEVDANNMRVISETQIQYEVNDTIEKVALSSDGSLLVVGTVDGALYLWDTVSKTQITSFQAHKKPSSASSKTFLSIVFSPDDSLFATRGVDQTIKVWSAKDGEEITSISNTEYGEMVFSPNNKSLAYASENSIHVKSLYEDTPEIVLNGKIPNKHFFALQFSLDGSMLVSGYSDKSVKIWSIANQSLLSDIPQLAQVSSVSFSPDETLLYIASEDGIVSSWGHASK
jgi:WD40 repeat protein